MTAEQFNSIVGEHARVAERDGVMQAVLNGIYEMVYQLRQEVREMAETTVTRADLDAAIAAQGAAAAQAFADLEAKIAAGAVATPEDFSAEVATLKAGLAAALAADPGAPAAAPAPVAAAPITPVAPAPVAAAPAAPVAAPAVHGISGSDPNPGTPASGPVVPPAGLTPAS